MKRLAWGLLMCCAWAGVAHAQSTVTLYTLLDVNVSRYSAGAKSNGGSLTLLNDGHVNGLQGSRWGVRVAEDLGGGLRAGAVLEGGVQVDTGAAAQGGRGFGRQAFASLALRGVGEMRFGRQYILSDAVVGECSPFGNGLVNNATTPVTNQGNSIPMFLNAPRADNVMQLQSAALGPVVLAAQYAPGEGTVDGFQGLRGTFAGGDAYAGLTYEWSRSRTTGADVNKSLTLVATYALGDIKLMGGLQRNRDLTTPSNNSAAAGVSLVVTGPTRFTMQRSDGWTVGAESTWGSLLLGLNYTRMRFEGAAGADADLGKIALGARYALSKRTFVYAGVSQATGGLKEYIVQNRVMQAGVRTAF